MHFLLLNKVQYIVNIIVRKKGRARRLLASLLKFGKKFKFGKNILKSNNNNNKTIFIFALPLDQKMMTNSICIFTPQLQTFLHTPMAIE